MWLLVLIIAGVILWVIKADNYDAARIRNSIATFASPEKGLCTECKHCIKDEALIHSDTGFYCRLSKAQNIDESTQMQCFEKPTVTETDLSELFSLGIWNEKGRQFIRESILGQKMTFTEVSNFLKTIPIEHPEYINPDYVSKD